MIGGEEITRIAQVFRGCIFLSSRGLLVKIGLPYTLCSGVSLVLPDSLERSQTGMRSLNALAVRASSTPILREGKHTTPLILLGGSENGAGDGNRTHVASLMAQYLINGQYSAVVNGFDRFERCRVVL